jgi:hypothetical protein
VAANEFLRLAPGAPCRSLAVALALGTSGRTGLHRAVAIYGLETIPVLAADPGSA